MDMKTCHADLLQGQMFVLMAINVVRKLHLAGSASWIVAAAERYLPQDHFFWETPCALMIKAQVYKASPFRPKQDNCDMTVNFRAPSRVG